MDIASTSSKNSSSLYVNLSPSAKASVPSVESSNSSDISKPNNSNGKKVLVVEDEKPLSKVLRLKLNAEGFDAEPAYNGLEAIEKFTQNKYDIVLLDLVMPEMDGFKVLKELKSLNSKVPVIVLSNLSQNEDIVKVKSLGASEFYSKSGTPIIEIVASIKKLLGINK